ncbi:microtubule nucleation factor SSNA1 [Cuculus canorus]|uniref:microtubule nucleation factor SSNA1 n=1 Tax=Cuculus canorus TaxID=55661 RepID=UPI0023AA31CD|nr:microtubule nucleation factor SSNA1 [Cuculus canorus]
MRAAGRGGAMSSALRRYEAELRDRLSELHARRSELAERIAAEQTEREKLQAQLWALTERLASSGESLSRLLAAHAELDRTITESEATYSKILENSQALGGILKGQAGNAGKASELQSTSKEKENPARGKKPS